MLLDEYPHSDILSFQWDYSFRESVCARTRGWVDGRGFRETENEKPGAAESTFLTRGSLFVSRNKIRCLYNNST